MLLHNRQPWRRDVGHFFETKQRLVCQSRQHNQFTFQSVYSIALPVDSLRKVEIIDQLKVELRF